MSLEQELSISKDLQEIYEDSDEEPPLKFNDPNDLMNILGAMEESNLL